MLTLKIIAFAETRGNGLRKEISAHTSHQTWRKLQVHWQLLACSSSPLKHYGAWHQILWPHPHVPAQTVSPAQSQVHTVVAWTKRRPCFTQQNPPQHGTEILQAAKVQGQGICCLHVKYVELRPRASTMGPTHVKLARYVRLGNTCDKLLDMYVFTLHRSSPRFWSPRQRLWFTALCSFKGWGMRW